MLQGLRVGVVIPALNEERSIALVIADIPSWVDQIVVADNGSTDDTAGVAETAGALVVCEPERGYGAACQTGIKHLRDVDIVVFMDGDYSDFPSEMHLLVAPIVNRAADLVIGSRVLGKAEPGALAPQQKFGNWLACWLIRRLYKVTYTDLGPFRAIRAASLSQLEMRDRNYGWTVEMQIKAARSGLSIAEVPVNYRRRIGVSKVSGTLKGSVLAGVIILSVIGRSFFRPAPVVTVP